MLARRILPAARRAVSHAAGAARGISTADLELSSLTAIGSIDGRYSGSVKELREFFGEHALIRHRVKVELAWLRTLASCKGVKEVPALTEDVLRVLTEIEDEFSIKDSERVKEIEKVTNHDVKAVEYFVKEKLAAGPAAMAKFIEFVHFGCTSEDVGNLAYASAIQDAKTEVLQPSMTKVIRTVTEMAVETADIPMLARTHGQPATPTTVGKELANFAHRMRRHQEEVEMTQVYGKFNGATGSYNALMAAYPDVDWEEQSKALVENELLLSHNAMTTQIEPHDWLAQLFHGTQRFNSVLLDLNRDMWGYISLGYFTQVAKEGEIGSSTMPHKVNPIAFENSEGNIGLANAVMAHLAEKLLVSRYQRDLSDSTVLRAIGVGFAHSLVAHKQTLTGLGRITPNRQRLDEDLEANWEVLAEPIQTVMRRYGVDQPYEKLKELTRGKRVSKEGMQAFVDTLADEGVPADAIERLRELTPQTYIGMAPKLARLPPVDQFVGFGSDSDE